MRRLLLLALSGAVLLPASAAADAKQITLTRVAGTTPPNAVVDPEQPQAEIAAYHAATDRIFTTNTEADTLDVYGHVLNPVLIARLALDGGPNSVAVRPDGLVGVAVEADPKTDPGKVQFFRADSLAQVGEAPAGALPDMLAGDELERETLARTPSLFNADHGLTPAADNRSDNKGPEPEGVAVGAVGGRQYAFAGLERHSGIAAYDLEDRPGKASLAALAHNRPADRGPEGIAFVPAAASPNAAPLVLVTNETSSTIGVWRVSRQPDRGPTPRAQHRPRRAPAPPGHPAIASGATE